MIEGGSFELPVLAQGDFTTEVEGWQTQLSPPAAAGVFFPPEGIYTEPTPDGNQVLFLRGQSRAFQTTQDSLVSGEWGKDGMRGS